MKVATSFLVPKAPQGTTLSQFPAQPVDSSSRITAIFLKRSLKGPNALEEIFEETKEKADEDGSEKKKKNKVKHQHFLHSLIHVKRLRQWLEVKHDEWENEEKKSSFS